MKLATLDDGTKDGELIVVNKSLTKAISAKQIVPNLLTALDDWGKYSPLLKEVYQIVNKETAPEIIFPLELEKLKAPLPRTFQFLDASAYLNHVELVRKARGADIPESIYSSPLVYQGISHEFLSSREPIIPGNADYGLDFEAEIGIITTEVPRSFDDDEIEPFIALFVLINDLSYRNLIPEEVGKGFGFLQSKPASSLSPIVVTLDEIEESWEENRLHLPLISRLNDEHFGSPNAGENMYFSFKEILKHVTKTRGLSAGTIIGSGTVSNRNTSVGSSCIAEKRMLEKLNGNGIKTEYLKSGDKIEILMQDQDGQNIFGSIEQEVL